MSLCHLTFTDGTQRFDRTILCEAEVWRRRWMWVGAPTCTSSCNVNWNVWKFITFAASTHTHTHRSIVKTKIPCFAQSQTIWFDHSNCQQLNVNFAKCKNVLWIPLQIKTVLSGLVELDEAIRRTLTDDEVWWPKPMATVLSTLDALERKRFSVSRNLILGFGETHEMPVKPRNRILAIRMTFATLTPQLNFSCAFSFDKRKRKRKLLVTRWCEFNLVAIEFKVFDCSDCFPWPLWQLC